MMENNYEYTFIFRDILIKALCLMMRSFNQRTVSVHSFGMLNVDLN